MSEPPYSWRGLPSPERVQYKEPPLVLTIFQIRFSPIWSIGNMSDVGRFQQCIMDDFPLSEKVDGVQIDFQMGPGGGSVNKSDMPKSWQFYDSGDEWKLTLTVDSLTIETRRYDSFEDLLGRINRAIGALITVYRPSALFRTGLRYINEIRESKLDGLSLLDAINPMLLGPIADPAFQSAVSQSTTEFVDFDELGRGLNMRFGYIGGGTTVQPASGVDSPTDAFFLVDLDFYRPFHDRTGTKLDASKVDEAANEFHSLVWQVWSWAVTLEYRNSLETV